MSEMPQDPGTPRSVIKGTDLSAFNIKPQSFFTFIVI
jgi:hypothetical protein